MLVPVSTVETSTAFFLEDMVDGGCTVTTERVVTSSGQEEDGEVAVKKQSPEHHGIPGFCISGVALS